MDINAYSYYWDIILEITPTAGGSGDIDLLLGFVYPVSCGENIQEEACARMMSRFT